MQHRSRVSMVGEMKWRLLRILNKYYLGKRAASKKHLATRLRESRSQWFLHLSPNQQASLITTTMKELGWRPFTSNPKRSANAFVRDTPWGGEGQVQDPMNLVPLLATAQEG